jgi:O-antigen/teichoic acid export membrane protein
MVGLLAFVVLMAAVFAYAWRAYSHSSIHPIMRPILLGLMASLVGALANGVFDHYFFNLAFHPAVTALWTFVGMTLAASRITLEAGDRGSGFELPTHA